MRIYKRKLNEYEDYVGSHSAPTNDGYCSPLYDVTLNGTYPEDIYSSNGARYYGDGTPEDRESISIIQKYRNKPNASLIIYRAVPNLDSESDLKIKQLSNTISFYLKFNFFPMSNARDKKNYIYFYDLEEMLDNKWRNGKLGDIGYDEYQEYVLEYIKSEIVKLEKEKHPKMKINNKDWVTISKKYAIGHGHHSLNSEFKILTKTVKAKELWTDGNSIHEWGYDK